MYERNSWLIAIIDLHFHMTGDLTGVSKLKGPLTYSFNELVFATKNFCDENKLGEGGFGSVFKVTSISFLILVLVTSLSKERKDVI